MKMPAIGVLGVSKKYAEKTPADFFKVLFNGDETTCLAPNMTGVFVPPIPVHLCLSGFNEFFSVNPLKGKRLDVNVTAYRNILIECDTIPLEKQLDYIESLGMPYSTAVSSGAKSIHFIISMADALKTRGEYDSLVRRIHGVVAEADKSTKNPSRLSRYPGHFRKGKGEQKLLAVKDRVPNWLVDEWLEDRGMAVEVESISPVVATPTVSLGGNKTLLNGFTKNLIMFGAPKGERNQSLFKAACDCRRVGMIAHEAVAFLETALPKLGDLSYLEFLSTIKSAYKAR